MATAIAFPPTERAEFAAAGWREIQEVPCELVAEIPVTGFTIGDLLLLQEGSLVNSRQLTKEKVGVHANGSFIAWAEFEVQNSRLGVRLTELP